MNGHDEALLDSVALLALGVLPADEAKIVRAHVETCDVCRREYGELRAAANAVGLAAEAGPGQISELQSARMRFRLMRAIRLETTPGGDPAAPVSGPRARWDLRLWYATVAALVVLAVFSALNVAALRGRHPSAAQVAALDQQLAAQNRQVAMLRRKVAQANRQVTVLRSRLKGQSRIELVLAKGTRFPVNHGSVVRGAGRLVLALQGLPSLPKGKVYQAWTLDRGATAMAPSVTFKPDPSGSAIVPIPHPATNVAAVAVSIEPAGGSKAPTSHPTFVRKLS